MNKKNYLITGATSFLGQALISHLYKSPQNKLLTASRSYFEHKSYDSDRMIHLNGIDLLNRDDLEKLKDTANFYFQNTFHLINCTGYYKGQEPFEDTTLEEGNKILESNYTTVYNTVSTLIEIMIEKGGGHIVSFSCNSVKYNYPQMAPFTAAKSALESLMRTVANEYYNHNIYANSFQLATLLTEHEINRKPNGDHGNWLKPKEVAAFIESFINQPNQILNGNSINLYHHSPSFFNQSYFERISINKENQK